MATGIPASIGDNIIEDIKALDGDTRNEFLIAKIRRDISKLVKIEPAQAYMTRGMLESVLYNEEASVRNFKNCLHLERSYTTLHNYALGLHRLSRLGDSLDYYRETLDEVRTSVEVARNVVNIAALLGKLSDVESDILKHATATVNTPSLIPAYYARTVDVFSSIDTGEVIALTDNVTSVLREHKKYIGLIEHIQLPIEGNPVVIQIGIENTSAEMIYTMNDELIELNCFDERFDISNSLVSAVFVACTPEHVLEEAI